MYICPPHHATKLTKHTLISHVCNGSMYSPTPSWRVIFSGWEIWDAKSLFSWAITIIAEISSELQEAKPALWPVWRDIYKLSSEKHMNKISQESYNLLRNIRVAFTYFDEDILRKITMTMIQPKLEYTAVVWSNSLNDPTRHVYTTFGWNLVIFTELIEQKQIT